MERLGAAAIKERASLRALLLYFLRLGTLGFVGPIALAGHMEQDLVEQRGERRETWAHCLLP